MYRGGGRDGGGSLESLIVLLTKMRNAKNLWPSSETLHHHFSLRTIILSHTALLIEHLICTFHEICSIWQIFSSHSINNYRISNYRTLVAPRAVSRSLPARERDFALSSLAEERPSAVSELRWEDYGNIDKSIRSFYLNLRTERSVSLIGTPMGL